MKYHKIDCKDTDETLKLCLPFISWNSYTKEGNKKKLQNSVVTELNLRKIWKFYTTPGGDGGDI
jgi:hypothetical protein